MRSAERRFQRTVQKAFHDPKILKKLGQDISFGEVLTPSVRTEIGPSVKSGVGDLFSNYNFNAKTWAGLVKSNTREANEANRVEYHNTSGTGILNRGDCATRFSCRRTR